MNHTTKTMKRLSLYLVGLFFLSLGISFSIEADLGVSPVSSLAYAFSLTTGFSVGMMTVVTHILFIIAQVMIRKQFDLRESIVQLIVALLFGFFVDITLLLVQLLPAPQSLVMRWGFLMISLFGVAIGLFGYMTAKFPLLPYDELTYVISEKFKIKFSKAKISSDLFSVALAGLICLIFIQSLGSIGIGTLVAAYFVGKILGFLIKHFRESLIQWINKDKKPRDDAPLQKQKHKKPFSDVQTELSSEVQN